MLEISDVFNHHRWLLHSAGQTNTKPPAISQIIDRTFDMCVCVRASFTRSVGRVILSRGHAHRGGSCCRSGLAWMPGFGGSAVEGGCWC